MRTLILCAVTALFALAAANGHEPKTWLFFFMKGDGARPTDKAELQKLQAAHMENLGKVVTAHGFAAGPLKDPTGERRGIAVLEGDSQSQVEGYMAHDAYVARKIMYPLAMEWKVDHKVFSKQWVDPNAIKEFRLVMFKPGKSMRPVNAQMMKEHAEYLDSLKKSHHMAIYGDLSTPYRYRGAAIFDSTDDAAIESALRLDNLVKVNLLEVEIIPLWMHKDTFVKSN